MPDRSRLRRRHYGTLTAAYVLFIVYGSLVPLQFRSLAFEEAVQHFWSVIRGAVSIEGRTDVVTNILLFVPLGYLLMATLVTDRRRLGPRAAAALLVVPSCLALSASLEFTQQFSAERVVALSDIIAETAGGILGVALWLFVGDAITGWVREFAVERERPALLQRLLVAYVIGFVVSQLMPLDLTLNLGELARKYRSGTIVLRPFGYTHVSWFAAVWDYFADVALSIPLGAAATVLWTKDRRRRASLTAFGIGAAFVASIELAQVFVMSRFADVTDVLTGSAGVAFGVFVAAKLSDRPVEESSGAKPGRVAVISRIAAIVWMAVLLSYHWYPFNFAPDRARIALGRQQLLTAPFSALYSGTEFTAFTQMNTKVLLALPLGALLRIAWPDGGRRSVALIRFAVVAIFGFAFLFAIEVGQIFLPSRYPDVTDALLGEAGLVLGMWLAGRLLSASPSPGIDS